MSDDDGSGSDDADEDDGASSSDLCHDGLESHSTSRRRSGGGWSGRSRRSRRLGSWPLQSKLSLTPSNSRCIYGTHDRKVWRLRIGDRRMVEKPRDSRREN